MSGLLFRAGSTTEGRRLTLSIGEVHRKVQEILIGVFFLPNMCVVTRLKAKLFNLCLGYI